MLDVDIPAIDTTTPNGHQAYMTRDQAYLLNSQVNSFLCSCPLYLDNGNVCALVFLGMMKRICMDWIRSRHHFWSKRSCSLHFRPSAQQQRRRSRRSCSFCFWPFLHQQWRRGRTELLVLFWTFHAPENRRGADGAVCPVSDLPHSRNFNRR